MKVLVIGATGTIGSLVVTHLLEMGHEVTAFARNPRKLSLPHGALTSIAGDAVDAADMAQAVAGHDAVVITLGAGKSRSGTIRSTGTLNAINAMQAHGVRRLICQSTLGAHDSWPNLDFFWKRIMFGALLRHVLRDHELQESLVRASGLDWTIVRPGAFTDGPATAAFRTGFGPDARGLTLRITRADVAAFVSAQLADLRFVRRAVAICN